MKKKEKSVKEKKTKEVNKVDENVVEEKELTADEIRRKELIASRTTLFHELVKLFWKIVLICSIILLIFIFFFGIIRYPDDAMAPAIHNGDLVIHYKLDKKYVASDVVIIKYEDKLQARRVIGVAGDEIDIRDDGVYINGARQVEMQIYKETLPYKEGVRMPVKLGANQLFLLADSREDAVDSRIYGPVNVNDTLGKVMTLVRRRNF